jgi:hypothetical protein
MKIDQEDFNRKAEHIIETVVKPQVERYERAKAIEMKKYPQWVNNLVYFLAGIGFGHILFNYFL